MRGLSAIGGQQGREGRWRQEGSSRGGEGGSATVITEGLWVVAVNERGVAGHGGGLAAQRFTPQRGRVDVGGELLGGRAEVWVWDERTPHAVVAGQHVRPCGEQYEALRKTKPSSSSWQQRKTTLSQNANWVIKTELAETVLTDLSWRQWWLTGGTSHLASGQMKVEWWTLPVKRKKTWNKTGGSEDFGGVTGILDEQIETDARFCVNCCFSQIHMKHALCLSWANSPTH